MVRSSSRSKRSILRPRRRSTAGLAAACGAALLLAAPVDASAEEEPPDRGDGAAIPDDRESPLAGQPAVRNRRILSRQRLELSPSFESTINADYRHTLSGGVKAEYHISDSWGLGVLGLFGASLNTGLTNRTIDSLPETAPETPEPSKSQYQQHLNSMPLHGAGYLSFKPFYGKLTAFSSLFLTYNLYLSAGLSVAVLENDCCDFATSPGDGDPRTDPPLNDGTRLGMYAGVGAQVFLNDFIALDMHVRDYYFRDNPSGLDFTGDLEVTDDDNRLMNHFAAGLGVSLFFPRSVDRTP